MWKGVREVEDTFWSNYGSVIVLLVVFFSLGIAFWAFVLSWFVKLIRYLWRWYQAGARPADFDVKRIVQDRKDVRVVPAIILFIVMLAVTFFMAVNGKLVLAICMGLIAVGILAVLLKARMRNEEELGIVTQLRAANKRHLFDREQTALLAAWHSVLLKEEFFREHNGTDSIRESYDLIRNAIEHDLNSAITFMEHYDWVLRPEPVYLRKLCKHASEMAKKLSELSDIVLEIDDSASDVDTSFAENMLASLKEMMD